MLDGVYKDGGFNGRLSMDDANGSVQIDGNFNVAKTIPDFNLKASVKNLPTTSICRTNMRMPVFRWVSLPISPANPLTT